MDKDDPIYTHLMKCFSVKKDEYTQLLEKYLNLQKKYNDLEADFFALRRRKLDSIKKALVKNLKNYLKDFERDY